MERLTNRNIEIPLPRPENADYWRRVHLKLASYEDAEEQGLFVRLPFEPGTIVWVVERDEYGDAAEVSGFVFLTACENAAIVSPSINGSYAIVDIIEDNIRNTAERYSTDASFYPVKDCYASREEAEAALAKEMKP